MVKLKLKENIQYKGLSQYSYYYPIGTLIVNGVQSVLLKGDTDDYPIYIFDITNLDFLENFIKETKKNYEKII